MADSPTVCRIDLDAIVANFKCLGEPRNLMPVIKADAYGHGMEMVATVLDDAGAGSFAVGAVSEGIKLRKLGFGQDIIVLMGCIDPQDYDLAVEYKLIPVIGNFDALKYIGQSATRVGSRPTRIALKINTGMSRLGFEPPQSIQLLEHLVRTPHIEPAYLLTHLANADCHDRLAETCSQYEAFACVKELLMSAYPDLRGSIANSAATLNGYRSGENEVKRVGFSLYGGNPLYPVYPDGWQLRPAMSLYTKVMETRTIHKGDGVSYGSTFIAPCAMKLAVLPIGYSNGIMRTLSNKMDVVINGQRARQIGTICMNMLMVDASEIENCKVGDIAWILGGEQASENISLEELSTYANTIPYELMCSYGSLNPRKYVLSAS